MAYSFLDLASDVLGKAEKPLTYQEIWQAGQDMGLASKIGSSGKTPWQTLGSQLYVDVRDNEASRFIKVGKRPARFFLRRRRNELTEAVDEKVQEVDQRQPNKLFGYKERDLHPVLTYFAFANPAFNRGRPVI